MTREEHNEHDAHLFHKVMRCLRAMRRSQHGLCEPRERKACTICNAKDELEQIIQEYKGAPIYPASGLD